jgi:Pyruvate/2-oxoacid:ferredoxin oxidoreductase delta subunit/Fe-S cluster biosynthesis and repair protein YggX
MTDDVYERVAEALDRLPDGFPRTDSGVELRIIKLILSPEEASLASELRESEPLDAIAERTGLSIEETEAKLAKMAEKGIVKAGMKDGKRTFKLVSMMGWMGQLVERNVIREDRLTPLDDIDMRQLIQLHEEWLAEGAYVATHKYSPPHSRVVPAQKALSRDQLLPWDDFDVILRSAKSFGVSHCNCRLEKDCLGIRKCDSPTKVCVFFSPVEGQPYPYRNTLAYQNLSKQEFLGILENAEEIGLVHTMVNVNVDGGEGYGWICNCCGDCCTALRGITQFGLTPGVAVAPANYFSVIDHDKCNQCGLCIQRCQVDAISAEGGAIAVDRDKCIGCGICVTGCPVDAARMERKSEAEIVQPPADFVALEHERQLSRGLIQ